MTTLNFKSIDIANFKTFTGEHTFEFQRPAGLYYITGKNVLAPELGANGVGKSTIFDALLWVLWGRTGRDNRPADAIKPWGKSGKTAVGVHIERAGGTFTLLRTRNPNSLRYWPALGDTPGKEIQQDEVPKLLGMSEEMFRRTLVLGQFGTLFLDLKPEPQAQMFTEALSLDVWLRAIDVASQTAKAAQRAADVAQANTATNDALLEEIAAQIETQQAKAETFDADKAQRIRKGERGIAQLEADIAAAEAEAVERPALPDTARLQKLRDELASWRTKHETARQALDRARQDETALSGRVAKRKAAKKPVCTECGQPVPQKEFDATTQTLAEELVALSAHVKDLFREFNHAREKVETHLSVVRSVEKEQEKLTASFGAQQDAWNAWTRKVSSIKGELRVWRDNMAKVQAETNQAEAEVAKLRKRRQTMRATTTTLKEQYEAAVTQVAHAEFWQTGFREIRLGIIDQTLVELEMATSRHAAMLGLNDWGIKFDTERETKAGTVSHGFSVLLYPPGQDTPVKWESYSGGESQRWQLATAFALSEVLLARAGLSPNIEVLDEPTKGLSGQGVSDLLEHLRDRALELGRAVYFVDHHSLDKGAFDGTLVVTKDKKGSTFKWQ